MTKRVLIVDDEFEILFLLQRVFEDFAGWQTVTATSSPEGLTKTKTEQLDAIVLDVSMPEMDGLQFVEQLQADPTTGTIPVVLLTAKVTPSDRQRFAQMNVAGVIAKPFDPIKVWQQVAEVLEWAS
jgi:CheY-like chemotaxis protein